MVGSRSHAALRIPIVRQVSGGACLIAADAGGSVCRWCRDAEVVFGYTTDQAIGLHIEQLVPFIGERTSELEGWCKRVDGSAFRGLVSSLSAAPEVSADDEANPSQVLVITDITSRYMREQAAQRVREHVDEVTTGVAHLGFFSLD